MNIKTNTDNRHADAHKFEIGSSTAQIIDHSVEKRKIEELFWK